MSPAGIVPGEAFGIASVGMALALTGIGSAELFGTAALTPGAVTITPSGIAPTEVFGLAALTGGAQVAWPPRAGTVTLTELATAGSVTLT